jgi:hypothetical protein
MLDERARRLWAAVEADTIGRGGVAALSRVSGLAPNTIKAGQRELADPTLVQDVPPGRTRRLGAGRHRAEETQPGYNEAVRKLVEPETRGDPMSPLKWTNKSTAQIAAALCKHGFMVSDRTVAKTLHEMGYSLQAMRKTHEGKEDHPDRDDQFRHIQRRIKKLQAGGAPVISVDCKKKELVGDFKNVGREWQPKGQPVPARTHDFMDKALGKVIPYGVYDILRNEGWVSVGIDHETAEFAAQTILRWWQKMGRRAYPVAHELLIVADGGGSNGSRNRLWKLQLQELADKTGLNIHVSHLPPGTSKWNKIEHRMFCHITQNWRGQALLSQEIAVNLIAGTKTKAGLRIRAALDARNYPKGIVVTDEDMASLFITPERFHGEWNYTLTPHEKST